MAVNVTFSRTPAGAAIADALAGGDTGLDHGNAVNGGETTEEDIYIRHDGANEITDVAFYAAQYSGVYGGDASAAGDFAELLAWGDAAIDDSINLDLDGGGTFDEYLRTGNMNSSVNAVALNDAGAGGTNPDDIGNAGEAHIKMKIVVPVAEDTAGIRQFDLVMKYTFTS